MRTLSRGLGRILYARAHPHDLKRAAQIPNGWPKPITSTTAWFSPMTCEGVSSQGGASASNIDAPPAQFALNRPVFYPRYWGGIAVKACTMILEDRCPQRGPERPDRYTYSDSYAPPRDDEFEQLSLYHATSGGEAALPARRSAPAFEERRRRICRSAE